MLLILIKNELIKLSKRKKSLVMLLAFFLLIGLITYGQYRSDKNYKTTQTVAYQIQSLEQSNESMKYEITNNTNLAEDSKKQFEQTIDANEAEIENLKKNVNATVDWKKNLTTEIKTLEEELKSDEIPDSQKAYIAQQLEIDKYLLNSNTKPVSDAELNASILLKVLYSALGVLFLAIGVSVFTADMVSGEYTPPTSKFLLTQPVSRGKVILSKFIASICASVFLIGISEVAAFILSGIVFGFGNMNYPVLIGVRYHYELTTLSQSVTKEIVAILGSGHLVPMWQYLLMTFSLQLLFVIACTSFAFLLSTLMKSSMVSMSVSIVTVIGITILQNFDFVRRVLAYVFISYGDVNTVVTGNIAFIVSKTYITPVYVVGVLALWTMVCYVIAHVVFVKRDLLV